jgi:hypothetical protein
VQHVIKRLAREDGGIELVLFRVGILAPAITDEEQYGSAI